MLGRRGVVALTVLPLAAAACAPTPADEGGRHRPPPHVERTVAPLAPSLTVTDPRGRTVTLEEPPERIVCLSGLCDDIVVALGMTPAGTSNPDVLTSPALLGAEGEAVPVVAGTFGNEDVESIAALEPDLVIGLSGVHDGLAQTVEEFAPLWLTEPATWQESVGYLRALGALTGRVEQAVAEEERFRGMLADAATTTHRDGRSERTAVLVYGSVDAIGVDTTASLKGDLLDHLFHYPFPARGSDAETASNYSVEELLARAPEVVFVYSLLFSDHDEPLSTQLADNPVWRRIPAVEAGAVHEMDAALWGKARGTRGLAAVVEQALDAVPAA
ncbi:ABC transporter substrate-binding protein [Saccharomonospora cyanea]|uniref:ABC-type Fe3+-hydroxamate transport system, periplasmic component n=1 Tax=Saccharomonospora cyanea NA-134 TaxID=882082 RepID=H5XDY4_9PSEU|nr:ABC transporter substrate-binding protein [Saccharomonospora cyanea]EHR59215.1 ABC-type Fe3+-hydroxamate transport system, periplasmic component [Saccharomonospora cyanea NA-134]